VNRRPRLTAAIADVRRAVRESLELAGVRQGELVLIACSGGPDSLALAAAAAFEGPRGGIRVGAIVVDHQMQAGSAEVAKATFDKLVALGLEPVEIKTVDVGTSGGPEAAARVARYGALDEAAARLDAVAILLGHTLDDQAETVLLGLARGSGARSLNGMAFHSGRYLRPLLGISRKTVENFCADSKLVPWLDPMNQDPRYTRVRVRKQILPMLETELGPGISDALVRTAEQLREDDEVLTTLSEQAFGQVASMKSNAVQLDVQGFQALPLAIRHRVVARALDILDAPTFARVHILGVDELVDRWHGQKPLTLPGVRVERTGEKIILKTTKTLKPGAC
jgi:tRNA(Ile)-lysidine synthase